MEKNRNGSLWIEQGYILFAEEGMDGIQIERLARILKLNKSSFYYHFGDLEGYYIELLRFHEEKGEHFRNELGRIKEFDPGLLKLLIVHSSSIMFQVQLTRRKHHYLFNDVRERVEQHMATALLAFWSEFFGIQNNEGLALRQYYVVRDMFYSRISFANLNYEFLHALAEETKLLFTDIQQLKPENDKGKISLL